MADIVPTRAKLLKAPTTYSAFQWICSGRSASKREKLESFKVTLKDKKEVLKLILTL